MNYFKDLTGEGITKFIACVGVSLLNWLMGTFTPIIFVLLLLGLLIVTDAILGCKVSIKRTGNVNLDVFGKHYGNLVGLVLLYGLHHELMLIY